MKIQGSPYFNAQHAPIGAFASFTLGARGPSGGLGLELPGPADESLYIGSEDLDKPSRFHAFPFFHTTDETAAEDKSYDVEGLSDFQRHHAIAAFADSEIVRSFGAAVDEWRAGDLTLKVFSQLRGVPDPETASDDALRAALVPAVIAELTLDNTKGQKPRKAFFGYAGSERNSKMRVWREGDVVGIGQGLGTGIATDSPGVYAGTAWQPEAILNFHHLENLRFLLGSLGLLVGVVPAGETRTFRFAVCFFREGTATTGLKTRYLYRRWFERIEEVASYTLGEADRIVRESKEVDRRLAESLTPDRQIMAAQAIRSYFGSTQCLELPTGEPLWVVNEGEYRMMNTFDLTVDQAFFELALNPWTVRNVLDQFSRRYSYVDELAMPGNPNKYPGGIAFTHDMGVANNFSEPATSGYEQAGLRGCFSFMSCEELVNWALTACLYLSHTGDAGWSKQNRDVFGAVLRSLAQRDHPDPCSRNGLMGFDSTRCAGGKEITTYDSLDASLGQARNNAYLAVKSWAAYVLLESVLAQLGDAELAAEAADQAARCASTLVASADRDGSVPAVLSEDVQARIIPAIEGLIYPFAAGRGDVLAVDGPFGDLISTLERHLQIVLSSGQCRFADGGWRLSSTSRNSWLSKIYLCQCVAEQVFGHDPDTVADAAHLSWLMEPENSYYAFSDQMMEGRAVGSRYYPRGVTCILWAAGAGRYPLQQIGADLALRQSGAELLP